MAIHTSENAETFARLADLLEIEDANPFRVRANRNASRTVGSHSKGGIPYAHCSLQVVLSRSRLRYRIAALGTCTRPKPDRNTNPCA